MLSLHWRPLPISTSNRLKVTSWSTGTSVTTHQIIIQYMVTRSQNMILLPIAIDPHGKWGPMAENFLRLSSTSLHCTFKPDRRNASIMCVKATTPPCPIGILRTADTIWKTTKQRPFFGYSHTSPTPSIFTIQKLGLGITKAFATRIRNATRKATVATNSHNHTRSKSLNQALV